MQYWFILLIGLFSNSSSFSQHEKVYKLNLESETILSIHTAMQNQQLSCSDLISKYIERIKKYNLSVKSHAPINAWTELNPSVFEDARQLDDSFKKTGKLVGKLHCIPIVVKDNIDSIGTTTSSGSYSLLGSHPIHDAFLVKQLRNAGAIILGKGGMDEFASGMFGINSRNGRIGNAYDPDRNPGGSSGGSAAAVSASFALLGIGTDNSGSVRIPAAFHGLVGLRPSTGLISQKGIFPMGNLDGIAGPIARTTKELAILLDVIAQVDPQEPKTRNIPRIKTYTEFLNIDGLNHKRIGVVHFVNNINTYNHMPQDIEEIIQNATHNMQKLGAIVVNIDLPKFDNDRESNQAGEIQDVNEYLSAFPSTRKNFLDICESNRTRNFGTIQECRHFIKTTASRDSEAYRKAQAIFSKNRDYVQEIMLKNNLDALLIPITTKGVATYDAMSVNTWRAPVSSNSGLPSINFNVGYAANSQPVGIELVGKQFHESNLIEMAYAYEKHAPQRINPKMPEENLTLQNASIAELNNLFTLLGKNAYEEVLIHSNSSGDNTIELTPEKFKGITANTIKRLDYK